MNGAGSRLRRPGDCPAIAEDVNLTAIMRREGIVNIHWDRLLDRFDVTLADWRAGGGATVGEGLANAKRRPS